MKPRSVWPGTVPVSKRAPFCALVTARCDREWSSSESEALGVPQGQAHSTVARVAHGWGEGSALMVSPADCEAE